MAFKMKHGAAPKFKELGSSPLPKTNSSPLNQGVMHTDFSDFGGGGGGYGGYGGGLVTSGGGGGSASSDKKSNSSTLDKVIDVASFLPFPWIAGPARAIKAIKIGNKLKNIIKGGGKVIKKTSDFTFKPLIKSKNVIVKNISRPIVLGGTTYGADQLAQMLTSDKTSLTEKQIYDATKNPKVINKLRVIRGKEIHGNDYNYNDAVNFRNQTQIKEGFTPGEIKYEDHVYLREKYPEYNAAQKTINNTIFSVNNTIDTLNKGFNIQ